MAGRADAARPARGRRRRALRRAVKRLLDDAGVAYELDGSLVRGLDYYTRTIFSFECDRLGAQSEIGGGGRYDALVEQLGGPATPAAGWAAGVERILLALDAPEVPPKVDVFIVAEGEQRERALALANELRAAGIAADLDLAERSQKGQMKQADRSGADAGVILDEDGDAQSCATWSGEQRAVEIDRDRRGAADERAESRHCAPNAYRDTWCGDVLADRVGTDACGSRAGSTAAATTAG